MLIISRFAKVQPEGLVTAGAVIPLHRLECFFSRDIFHFEPFNFKKLVFHSGGHVWETSLKSKDRKKDGVK